VRVIIMGCGRVGARLATLLADDQHEVTVLDVNERAFERLPTGFSGTALVGNGIDVDVLRRAGIERVDAFAAVTQGDNRNIMASQMAKYIFHVPRVVTRIYDPIRSDTYQTLGIDAVSPTVIGAQSLYDRLMAEKAEE
jgi:trk system potassium uptake protein TrkA